MNRQRFGDVGGVKPGGFVAGTWTRDGKDLLGFGWSGAWRRWTTRNISSDEGEAGMTGMAVGNESWTEIPAVFGHFGPVKGIAWDAQGNYLMSTRYGDIFGVDE